MTYAEEALIVSDVHTRDRSSPDGDWNHQFTDVNGVKIHYVREGSHEKQGMPVFLLHGWPEFWWSWHRVIPALELSFDIIAPDLRGFGLSKNTAKGVNPDVDVHAEDIVALAD